MERCGRLGGFIRSDIWKFKGPNCDRSWATCRLLAASAAAPELHRPKMPRERPFDVRLTQGSPEDRTTLGFVVERFQRTRNRKLSSRGTDNIKWPTGNGEYNLERTLPPHEFSQFRPPIPRSGQLRLF